MGASAVAAPAGALRSALLDSSGTLANAEVGGVGGTWGSIDAAGMAIRVLRRKAGYIVACG